jgi:hypothetical protein
MRVDGSESGMPLSVPAREAGVSGSLEVLPRETLAAMLEAGREVLEWRRILAKTGDNVVGLVLRHEGPFYTLDHYPKGDVFDPESHAQWYYHAHDKKDRPDFEPKAAPNDLVCHLVAVSMDRSGWPVALFTINRWVTGETWYSAADVAAMLDRFDMKVDKPSWSVSRWLSGMLRLFRPQIEQLLQQRDARIREWQAAHPEANAYEDRGLEVTAQLPIDVEAQVRALEQRLGA